MLPTCDVLQLQKKGDYVQRKKKCGGLEVYGTVNLETCYLRGELVLKWVKWLER